MRPLGLTRISGQCLSRNQSERYECWNKRTKYKVQCSIKVTKFVAINEEVKSIQTSQIQCFKSK